jgi:hypothetical protein
LQGCLFFHYLHLLYFSEAETQTDLIEDPREAHVHQTPGSKFSTPLSKIGSPSKLSFLE